MCRFSYVCARLLIVAFLLPSLVPAGARADEAQGTEPIEAEDAEAVRVLTDEEAAALIKQIKTLSRKRDAAPLVKVLLEVGVATHEDLPKLLVPLLEHKSKAVALQAGSLLKVQVVARDRDRARLAGAVWKSGWADRKNHRRYGVRGRALRAHASLSGEVIDAGKWRAVRGVWQELIGDPRTQFAPGMVEICRYVRESKDKRFCRLLAEEIDTPLATDVNSPSNPPGEWWERRWKMWREYNAEAVEALEVLTGETFKTTKDAKAWFKEHEREFGFRW